MKKGLIMAAAVAGSLIGSSNVQADGLDQCDDSKNPRYFEIGVHEICYGGRASVMSVLEYDEEIGVYESQRKTIKALIRHKCAGKFVLQPKPIEAIPLDRATNL